MTDEILSAIPHRPPMLLVDAVIAREENRIVCAKTFRADEFFFQGHYPGQPIVPGVILCEAGMQAGAILLATQMAGAPGVPVAARLNDVKFKKVIRPGDTIEMDVTLNERVKNAFFLSARINCGGKPAVRFDFTCTMAEVE